MAQTGKTADRASAPVLYYTFASAVISGSPPHRPRSSVLSSSFTSTRCGGAEVRDVPWAPHHHHWDLCCSPPHECVRRLLQFFVIVATFLLLVAATWSMAEIRSARRRLCLSDWSVISRNWSILVDILLLIGTIEESPEMRLYPMIS